MGQHGDGRRHQHRHRSPPRRGVAADVSYGSYNTANANVGGSIAVNDNLKVGLNYNHAQSSGYNLTPAQYQNANLVPTASKADNIDFSTYFTTGDNLKLFAKAYFHQAYEDGLVWSLSHNNWSSYRLLVGGSYELDDKSSINFSAWGGGGTFGTINTASGSYTLNNIDATNQFVSQIEHGAQLPTRAARSSIRPSSGRCRTSRSASTRRRTVISDYNNLYASATAAPTRFIANGEHRLAGRLRPGHLPLHRHSARRHDRPCAAISGRRSTPTCCTVNSATNNPVANSSASELRSAHRAEVPRHRRADAARRGLPQLLRARA